LNTFGRRLVDDVIYKMDKIFENFILKTYFCCAINWNRLNNFDQNPISGFRGRRLNEKS